MKTFKDEGITFFTDDTFFIVATGMKWVSYTKIHLCYEYFINCPVLLGC